MKLGKHFSSRDSQSWMCIGFKGNKLLNNKQPKFQKKCKFDGTFHFDETFLNNINSIINKGTSPLD